VGTISCHKTVLLVLVLILTSVDISVAQEYTVSQTEDSATYVEQDTSAEASGFSSALSQYSRRAVERFDKSPLFVTILYVVILYSIITLVVLLIIILLNRNRLQREEKQTNYLKEVYQLKLMDYLFEDEKQDEVRNDLKEIAENRFDRQLLIDQMIDLSINLKGEIKETIKELYLFLGLKEDSVRKVQSKKWHENVKGIRELAYMNIREASEKILEYLNSTNEIVRMEAQIAMVRLSDENPYHFLHFMEKPLAVWEQITLHELLIQHNLEVPVFQQWFESENLSVVIFALEMTAWFKQVNSGESVIGLFEHENENVRHTAFRVCGEIELSSALPAMEQVYEKETDKNKLEILSAFANIPEERHLGFLKSVLDMEDNVQLQIQATKAMENTDEPGISMLIKLMKSKSEYKNYQIIIRHVLDGRIY
jgi:hypothetical protein